MGCTRLSLENALRYGRRDYDASQPSIASAYYWSIINRAIRAINMLLNIGQDDDTLVGDGVNYKFQLRGVHSTSVLAADYIGLKSLRHDYGIIEGAIDIAKIDAIISNSGMIESYPTEYALWGGYIYLNAIPSNGTNLYFRFYRELAALSETAGGAGDADAPEYPLNQFDQVIVYKAKELLATDDENIADELRYRKRFEGACVPLIKLLEQGGKRQALSNTVRPSII